METLTPPTILNLEGVDCVLVNMGDPVRAPYRGSLVGWGSPCAYCPINTIKREERRAKCCPEPARPNEVWVPLHIYALARMGAPLPESAPRPND